MADPQRTTIVRIPAGQSIDLFSSLSGFFNTVLEDLQLVPGDEHGTAADVVTTAGVTERQVITALRQATRRLGGRLAPAGPDDELAEDVDDEPFRLNAVRATETGMEFSLGGSDELAREAAAYFLGAFIPALEEMGADNYLSWELVDPDTQGRYAVSVVKPGGLAPHEARQRAEREVDRLRALCVANKIDPDRTDVDG